MKTILQSLKSITWVFALFLAVSQVQAQTRTASVTGPWSSTTTWGGASVPTSVNDVVVNNGITVTVDVAADCNSITFGSASGTVTVNSGITLNVVTGITLQNAVTGNRAASLAGSGTINCASVQVGGTILAPNLTGNGNTTLTSTISNLSISGDLTLRGVDDGNDDNNPTLNFQSGTISITGTVNLSEDAGSAVNFTLASGAQSGTLVLIGSTPFTVTGSPTFEPNGSNATVNYSGNIQTVLADTYNNLILSGSGVKTTTGVTVNTKLTLQGTATVGNSITYSTAILEYNGSAAQTTSLNELSSNNNNIDQVIINNSNGVTLNNATTINDADIYLTSGVFATGTNLTISTAGQPIINISEGSMTGTLQGTGDYNVVYTGSSKTTGAELSGSGLLNLTVNLTTGETLTLDANRAPDGVITLDEGVFDIGGFTINRSSAGGTLTINNGATLRIGGTNSFPTNYSTHSIANTDATVEYSGTAQTVSALNSGEVYTILILSGSGVKNFSGARTISVKLFMQGSATASGTSPTFSAGADLEYAGSVAQTTGIEFPAASGPADLIINNASGVTLSGARTLSGSLTLTNGVLTTTATEYLNLANNATASAGSNTSYVDGPLRKTGNDAFTFPIGKNGLYSPLTITAPDATGDAFQAEYMRASGTALGGISAAGLYRVSNCEYWLLDEISDAGSANTVSVTVGWFINSGCGGNGYVTDISGITLAHFNTGTNMWDSYGGTASGNPTTGTITRTGVNTFSPFTLGSTIDNANPLPVKFSGIKAFEKQSGIQIDWAAYNEENVDIYQVERSADGVLFVPIGDVDARNSVTETKYSFFDAAPLSGVNFYRLRNVDIDGKSGYSNIVKVSLDKSVKSITIYPNPVRGEFISLQSSDLGKGNYSVRVMNSAGQQVYMQRFSHTGGAINETIQLPSGMQSGIYILQLDKEGTKVLAKAFVVQQ